MHVVWSSWRESGVRTVLLINCLILRVETSMPCPRCGNWEASAGGWPEPFSINGLPLILVQDREVKSLIYCTSPLGKCQHWLQNAARFYPISLSILSHLRKQFPPADSESQCGGFLYKACGQVQKVQLVINSLLEETKPVIKVPLRILWLLMSDNNLAHLLYISFLLIKMVSWLRGVRGA